MRTLMLTTAASVAFLAGTGLPQAQQQYPGGSAQAASPAQQAFQQKLESERQACRQQAVAQGVQTSQMQTAVMACMARIEPMAAKRMGCVREAQGRGLSGQEAIRPYVQSCMARQG